LLRRFRSFAQWVVYAGLRPLLRALPTRGYDRVARVLAVPAGLLLAVTERRRTRDVLALLGHADGPLVRVRFGYKQALARLRAAALYVYGEVPYRWGDRFRHAVASGQPAVFVYWNTHGIDTYVVCFRAAGKLIRIPWGGEGGPRADEVAWADAWSAYKAEVRHTLSKPYQLVPGARRGQYAEALADGHSLFVAQDVPDPTGRSPRRQMFGRSIPMPVGGVGIARRAGLPLYVVDLTVTDGVLRAEADGPLDLDEQALVDRLEAEIRRRPWEWTLAPEFFEIWDAEAAAERAVAELLPEALPPSGDGASGLLGLLPSGREEDVVQDETVPG